MPYFTNESVGSRQSSQGRVQAGQTRACGNLLNPADFLPTYVDMPLSRANPQLSLCMIVRDEADRLSRCLASVRDYVDEIVVVDTGSSDSSIEIALSYDARVHHLDWPADFSAARNHAIEKASGDWILMLDADEELEPVTPEALQKLLRAEAVSGYMLRFKNLLPPGEIQPFEIVHLTRLFRNHAAIRYEGMIHEQVRPSILRAGGCIHDADLTVIHHGYQVKEVQDGEDRSLRNHRLLEPAVKQSPQDPYLNYQYAISLKTQGECETAIGYFTRWIELEGEKLLNPTSRARGYLMLAQCYITRDDYEQGLRYARMAIETDSQNLAARYVVTVCCIFLGRLQEARSQMEYLRTHPQVNAEYLSGLEQVLG